MKIIGLKRLTVKLLSHNPKWKDVFEVEAKKLRKLFLHVEHIGSTAIEGIKAKPIIDIIAGAPSMARSKEYIGPLKKIGFELRPFGGPSKHLLFVKGKESNRTHYLHLIKFNGQIWKNDLFFRDYLNKNKKAALAYEKLKLLLARKFADERSKYTKAKWKFIKNIISKRR
ncbi:MAG: GrpB family protein [bacterium]|nr:GrpB family protein [bacterium]